MVTLGTVKRVLALDLGLKAEALERCWNDLVPGAEFGSDTTEIPLAEALRIVGVAEQMIASSVAA